MMGALGWWAGRSEKFRQTVAVALIGAIPGTLAGVAGLLKKQDEKTAREVYSVLVKLIEHLSNENDATQRNVAATHTNLQQLSARVDDLSKRLDSAAASSAVASLPEAKGAKVVISRRAAPRPMPPAATTLAENTVVEMPANWE
jgi:chromosome segregation ATPase